MHELPGIRFLPFRERFVPNRPAPMHHRLEYWAYHLVVPWSEFRPLALLGQEVDPEAPRLKRLQCGV
ncbi:hypothetical protein D3C78_1817090 [compost metagenome]